MVFPAEARKRPIRPPAPTPTTRESIESAEQQRTTTPIGSLGSRPCRNRSTTARRAGSCSFSLSAMEGGG